MFSFLGTFKSSIVLTGYKPFKCLTCQNEFLTGSLLKAHMEAHVIERRYKCGECGKMFKAIGHVREHMKAHSEERPHHCKFCDNSYKTKVTPEKLPTLTEQPKVHRVWCHFSVRLSYRTLFRCTTAHIVKTNPTSVRTALAGSGKRALWCVTFGTIRVKSRSSAPNAVEVSQNMAPSIAIYDQKVKVQG